MPEVPSPQYPTQFPTPTNPLDTVGKYQSVSNAMVQNKLLQQQNLQAQMATQQQADEQGAMQSLQNYKNDDGKTFNYNKWLQDVAVNHPRAIMSGIKLRNEQTALTNAGIYTSGPQAGAARQVPQEAAAGAMGGNVDNNTPAPQEAPAESQQGGPVNLTKPAAVAPVAPQSNDPYAGAPSVQTSLPAGGSPLEQSRKNYNEVGEAAKGAPTMNAAYNEVINLNKAGAPSGTNIATMYQWLAKNVPGVPQGITDKAAQAQELGKWYSQGLLANGMPGSDARLNELQHANLNPDQLPQTVKELAPFFKAVSKGAIAKQNYYNKVTDNGANLATEPHALQQWNNNYDPRWLEFDELTNKKDQHAFLVKHPDLLDKKDQMNNLQNMGVIKGGQ